MEISSLATSMTIGVLLCSSDDWSYIAPVYPAVPSATTLAPAISAAFLYFFVDNVAFWALRKLSSFILLINKSSFSMSIALSCAKKRVDILE